MNAFAIPEQLAAAADNPARALRAGCSAQYLGVPQSMGEALFGDPIGDADFFCARRSSAIDSPPSTPSISKARSPWSTTSSPAAPT